MEFADPEALLDRLTSLTREVVFLVGAPLTAPAGPAGRGVPGVAAMIERIRALYQQSPPRALAKLDAALAALAPTDNRYQAAFRHVIHHRGTDAANAVIRDAVLEARIDLRERAQAERAQARLDEAACEQLENDLDGWHYPPAVLALGQLVAHHAARFGGTVLTTNFDPLLELSIRRAGGRAYSSVLPSDGSLEQARGQGCHVVHLHGYWHGTDTLHAALSLGQERPRLRASLGRLFRERTIVVIAYGGWDDIFTRTLEEVTADQGANPDVLWCFYERDPETIERASKALFEQLKPAIGRQRVVFYAGIDCHAFLPALVTELAPARAAAGTQTIAAGAPAAAVAVQTNGAGGAIRAGELSPAREETTWAARKAEQDELLRAFERGQPVQILGPRSMGKSSLLRWMERSARSLGRRVAFVNALGLAGRSPAELVLAAAEVLGVRAQVKQALFAESAMPGADAAAQALGLLGPACLLVDNAGALADAGHGFDRGFFDALRALGQEGKLQWISASEEDLFALFSSTGLTSAFLNDARKIRVGAFSRAEAEAFLRDRGASAEDAAFAVELGGGFPAALGWIGQRIARGGGVGNADGAGSAGDRAALERELGRWIKPLFLVWWQRLGPARQALLKQSAAEGAPVGELSDGDRRMARGLVEAGFLEEREGRFAIGGRAFAAFVRDVG